MAIDASFKNLFRELVSTFGWKLRGSIKVGKLPFEIDVVAEFSAQRNFKYLHPFYVILQHSHAERLIIEFKSHRDRLKFSDLPKLIAYRYLFFYKFDPPISMRTAEVFLTTTYPRNFLNDVKYEILDTGIFTITFDNRLLYLISINRLEATTRNLGLLIFSNSSRKIKAVFDLMEKIEFPFEETFLSVMTHYSYDILKPIAEQKGFDMTTILEKNYRLIAEDLGKDKAFQILTKLIGKKEAFKIMANQVGEKEAFKIMANQVGEKEAFKIMANQVGEKEAFKIMTEQIGIDKAWDTLIEISDKNTIRQIYNRLSKKVQNEN